MTTTTNRGCRTRAMTSLRAVLSYHGTPTAAAAAAASHTAATTAASAAAPDRSGAAVGPVPVVVQALPPPPPPAVHLSTLELAASCPSPFAVAHHRSPLPSTSYCSTSSRSLSAMVLEDDDGSDDRAVPLLRPTPIATTAASGGMECENSDDWCVGGIVGVGSGVVMLPPPSPPRMQVGRCVPPPLAAEQHHNHRAAGVPNTSTSGSSGSGSSTPVAVAVGAAAPEAVLDAHEWYEKYACYLPDRAGGAKNPSPDCQQQQQHQQQGQNNGLQLHHDDDAQAAVSAPLLYEHCRHNNNSNNSNFDCDYYNYKRGRFALSTGHSVSPLNVGGGGGGGGSTSVDAAAAARTSCGTASAESSASPLLPLRNNSSTTILRPVAVRPCEQLLEEEEERRFLLASLSPTTSSPSSSAVALMNGAFFGELHSPATAATSLEPTSSASDSDDGYYNEATAAPTSMSPTFALNDTSPAAGMERSMMATATSSSSSGIQPALVLRRPIAARPGTSALESARDALLHALSVSGGETAGNANFARSLAILHAVYQRSGRDVRHNSESEGTWLTLTKPVYRDCLGQNEADDPLYTLGRMGFDMFLPTALVCSLQGNFNTVHAVADHDPTVPPALARHVQRAAAATAPDGVHRTTATLRTYNVLTAFTIEPSLAVAETTTAAASFERAPNRRVPTPIRGILSTRGYILADPVTPNRHSVWIASGSLQANDSAVDQANWQRFFNPAHNHNSATTASSIAAKLLARKLLLGAEVVVKNSSGTTIGGSGNCDADGGGAVSMEYHFRTPLGGLGAAHVDTLYLDESLRVVRGHRGTIFVFSKMR